MRKIIWRQLTICLTILLSGIAIAQEDNLLDEILEIKETRTDVIKKGRQLIINNLEVGNFDKVQELVTYLNKEAGNSYMAFTEFEMWMLLYVTGNYSDLPEKFLASHKRENSFDAKMEPPKDNLAKILVNEAYNTKNIIIGNLYESELSDIDKDFLQLVFNSFYTDEQNINYQQEDLNADADRFLSSYPDSKYESFVRNEIRYVFKTSDWAFGFELFTGNARLSGGLQQNFKNSAMLGVGFDVGYRNWMSYWRINMGFSNVKADSIKVDNIPWFSGNRADLLVPELSLGYKVLNNEKCEVVPFVGIGGTSFTPSEAAINKDPVLADLSLGPKINYLLGVNVDIKFAQNRATELGETGNGYVRLRYTYNLANLHKENPMFSGNVHLITIGFGGIGRSIRRMF